jgi:hypothetical protein
VVREWRDKHPDEAVPDGLVLTQPSTNAEKTRGIPDRVIYHPSWAKLVHTGAADLGQGVAEAVG